MRHRTRYWWLLQWQELLNNEEQIWTVSGSLPPVAAGLQSSINFHSYIYRELWCFCLQSRTRLKIWFESKMKKYSIFGRRSGAKNWGLFMHGREISKHWPLAEFVVLRFWGCCKLFQSEEIWPSFNLHFQVQNMWSSGGGENIVHLISLDEAYLVQIGHGVAHHLL